MEAVMIAGVAVVVVGGWYSALDLLADMGIKLKKPGSIKSGYSVLNSFPSQRRIKQMAGMNI
jgi:hypothetical protein